MSKCVWGVWMERRVAQPEGAGPTCDSQLEACQQPGSVTSRRLRWVQLVMVLAGGHGHVLWLVDMVVC